MAILLRYNGQKDASFDNIANLSVGDIVRCTGVNNSFATLPATIYFNTDLTKDNYRCPANLNCFDYVPKSEHPNILRGMSANG